MVVAEMVIYVCFQSSEVGQDVATAIIAVLVLLCERHDLADTLVFEVPEAAPGDRVAQLGHLGDPVDRWGVCPGWDSPEHPDMILGDLSSHSGYLLLTDLVGRQRPSAHEADPVHGRAPLA